MIGYQLCIWVVLSVISGFIAYVVLTEGKNRFLLVITLLFNVFLGMGTSYIWLQTTKGLALYGWALYVLPLLIASIATILLLSYYKAYHGKTSFPKIPTFSVSRASSMISLIVIVVLSVMLASMYFPSSAPMPTISTLGSTNSAVISAEDIVNISECIDCIKSEDIKIQTGILSATSFRENPRVNEYLDFRIDLSPSFSYLNPSLKVFIEDWNGNLIPSTNIISYQTTSVNSLEGQIFCDEAGVFKITAVLYDAAMSTTQPIASSTLSYTVTEGVETAGSNEPADLFTLYMVLFFCVIVAFIWVVALYKKYS